MFTKELPEWNAAGIKPPQTRLDEGWQEGVKPPAPWFNWWMNTTYQALLEVREVLENFEGISSADELDYDGTGTKSTKQAIDDVQEKVTTHKAEGVHLGEAHGLRATNGKLEYFNGTEWKTVSGGLPVGNVSNFTAQAGNAQVTLTWTDPADVVLDGATIARWKGTKVLRKTGSYPINENDGVLVVDSGVRNQYSTTGFVDTGLTNGTTYYYSAFSYTEDGIYDAKSDVSATPTESKIYGVRVDKNNSNPETRVTYIGDAVGFTPMRGNNGNLQWGSWQGTDLLKDIKPCVLQNLGGGNAQVNYYLNPNNYAQKEDGTSAIINGNDGDVMIEIPERYWKFTDEGTTYTVKVSDKPFTGAVKLAHEIEDGYNQVPFYTLLLTQCIMLILLKSTDTQSALGRGRVDGATEYASTGGTNNKGMFYGSTLDEQMKFLGIEDYWGNKLCWIDGLFYSTNRDMLIGLGNFNDTGSGYTNHGHSGFASDTGGYVDAIQGGNQTGFIPKAVTGSGTTYYADYGNVGAGRIPYFGGHQANGDNAGGFYLYSISAAISGARIGARLCFKKGDKLYVGVYLGTVTGGRLRSVSGTSEPTGSKTIGAFRTDAKANNN
ncbi:hypothetical protein M3689_05535 [Alkalihalophilus marmarensis]|uniref:hypothetical protein n=1 Tax=Alkalihalophilus marmarensis TaxID=521377 RepID=UPI0020415EE7|nr:hypothetical protein [Alkalihalophilus marmarensis]MCM3488768.1 hypothetical protein [Alkalihalophilus marmarensis]